MIFCMLRGFNSNVLDRLVDEFRPGRPVHDSSGRRIGSLVRVWRDGDRLMGEAKIAQEEQDRIFAEAAKRRYPWAGI